MVMVSWFFMLFFMLIWVKFFGKSKDYGVLYMKATTMSRCSQKFFALSDVHRSFIILNRTIVRTTVSLNKGA